MEYRKTIILGYEKCGDEQIPIVECIPRTDWPDGLRFYCVFCNKYHLHGDGEGHRVAHCHNGDSPFDKTGYILKIKHGGSNSSKA